jgi:hypothetical protein
MQTIKTLAARATAPTVTLRNRERIANAAGG